MRRVHYGQMGKAPKIASTIFKVFGMTQPGIEPMSSGPLANTKDFKCWMLLPIQFVSWVLWYFNCCWAFYAKIVFFVTCLIVLTKFINPVSWDCRIHWIHLCQIVRHFPKPSHSEAPVLEGNVEYLFTFITSK